MADFHLLGVQYFSRNTIGIPAAEFSEKKSATGEMVVASCATVGSCDRLAWILEKVESRGLACYPLAPCCGHHLPVWHGEVLDTDIDIGR